jgi:hypothetical protein
LTARIRAASLRSQPEEDVVLIGSRFPNLEAWVSELQPVLTEVVNITLEQLAEPDEQTPWQDLIEFRNDDNSRQQQLALRRWMRKMASGNFKQLEIAEELEYLYHEYERHMALHRIKINKGTLETIFTLAGEVAENLVKIKWGQLVKLCFVSKHRKIDLLEAEANAPGREVAYIANTRSRFQ